MKDELINLLADLAMVNPDDIIGDECLAADLGLSSTDLYELAVAFSDALGEDPEDVDLDDLGDLTVDEFYARIADED